MRKAHWRAAAAAPLAAALVAGCGGGSKKEPPVTAGKVVAGETQSGMKMTVSTFVNPNSDPTLKKLEAYREAGGFPAVDYHRVVADNSKGQVADREWTVTFAPSQASISGGQGTPAAFLCDTLNFEWPPKQGSKPSAATYDQLMKKVCAIQPSQAGTIGAGKSATYYLVTDHSFSSRGIRGRNVFGPAGAQFVPVVAR